LRLYAAGTALDCIAQYTDTKSQVALVVWESEQMRDPQVLGASHIQQVTIPEQSGLFASRLYRLLRDLDDHSWDLIVMPEPPIGQEWDGVRDRLQRACFGSGPPVNSHVSN
jgi:L-threonylcarbamoyladenylate synthase